MSKNAIVNKNTIRKLSKSALWALALSVSTFLICDKLLYPLPDEKLRRPPAHYIYSAEGLSLGRYTSEDKFWRLPVKLEEISPRLISSVIQCEDKWFYHHPGVNPVSILTAAYDNIKAGHIVRGGSTITMQIARMIEPKERTITNKIFEIFRALQLELRYSKVELLEFYFNLAPYGGNIEGAATAAQHYFDHSISELTVSEAAILTSIPASPNRYRPDRNASALIKRRDLTLRKLLNAGTINNDDYQNALAEEIPYQRTKTVALAPHLCQQVISRQPDSPVVTTTINHQSQTLCTNLTKQHHQSLKKKGIYNLAVIVIENKTGKIRAQIGSPNFADNLHGGQVNAALAPRSPGSTLKPFIYALAFEQGKITPSSLLEDVPVNFSGYKPENYDQEYHGVVTVTDALIRSLNVPAVNLTANVGLSSLYNLLINGGITSLHKSAAEHGLPLILGGCEISLLELTALYSTLSREGTYLQPSFLNDTQLQNTNHINPNRILTKEACYLVSEILVDLERPTLSSAWEHTENIPHVAWKTGTSYGRRDAWAVGYDPTYTIGVWAGNVSGEGSPDIVGAEIAAPLLFSIFGEISAKNSKRWLKAPDAIGQRNVCALSGEPPNANCPETKLAHYIKDVSEISRCNIHAQVLLNSQENKLLCRACAPHHNAKLKTIERWPARLSSWLIGQGAASALPEHYPQCSGQLAKAHAPVLTSPESFGVYKIRNDAPLEHQLILLAASVSADCSKIHWFVDNNLLTVASPNERVFYTPKAGKHQILCVDDRGRSTTAEITIE